MLMLMALGVMKAAIDVPLALATAGLGILIVHCALVGSRIHVTDMRRVIGGAGRPKPL